MPARKKARPSKTNRKTATQKPAKKSASAKRAGVSPPRRRTRSSEGASGSDSIPILYIHGIGEQPPAEILKREWDLALFGSDRGDETQMVYWADIVHPPSEEGRRARATSHRTAVEIDEVLAAAGVDPENKEAREFARALAEDLAARSGGARADGARTKVLPLPGSLRRPIARAFLRRFIPDTAAYFFDPAVRKRIQRRLIDALPKEPFVLVAHSQGTIISYEVLSTLRRSMDVALLVTLGSSLGIREIQDLIEDGGLPLEVPAAVSLWQNFADRLDPVALDSGLRLDFTPSKSGVKIRDHQIVNRRTARLEPHAAVGYLAHPKVRQPVHAAIGFDPQSRFIVARDVAEGFADRSLRQPVLIETLDPGYTALGETQSACKQREAPQRKSGVIERRPEYLARVITEKLANDGIPREEARVDALRRYVSAHLTMQEVQWVASEHASLNVYSVWQSATKSKLLGRSHRALRADAARASYGADGADITWAVLDTGARLDHPHFRTNETILEVLDCTRSGSGLVPITAEAKSDRDGHGTHVSAIIAGESKDKRAGTIQGLAPKAKLIVYKVLDDEGFGEDAWILKALDDIYLRNERASGLAIHGVNLSLGGPFDPTVYGCGHSPICQGIRELWRGGVVACLAAGNEGQIPVLTSDGDFDLNTQLSIGDPANLEEAIAVGSVHKEKPTLYGVSHFSSRGPTADGRKKPDAVAPGERILSANSNFKRRGARAYREDSGTSMACPHVSGLIASFLSVRREFIGEPDRVKRILLENCNDLGRDPYHQGSGIPNLMKMLLNA